jgi:nucleotide-binding universal stress UspA family protein
MNFGKVLIAVDSSITSMSAAKKGLELAHRLKASTALLFAVDTSKAVGNVDAGITREQALIMLKQEAERTLDQLEKLYNGDELFKYTPEGHPVDEIIRMSETWEADIIVMGTHGRTGLSHLLMGSTAESVLRRSKVPVMVVRSF